MRTADSLSSYDLANTILAKQGSRWSITPRTLNCLVYATLCEYAPERIIGDDLVVAAGRVPYLAGLRWKFDSYGADRPIRDYVRDAGGGAFTAVRGWIPRLDVAVDRAWALRDYIDDSHIIGPGTPHAAALAEGRTFLLPADLVPVEVF